MSRASGAPEALADRVARLLLEARATGRQIGRDARPELSDLADVYRAQDLVVRALSAGARVRAWKVSPPRAGADPRAAPIPPAAVRDSPARIPAANLHGIGIEAEIAFRFARDLPVVQDEREVAAAVSEALAAIEICDTRLTDGDQAPALWKLADLQSNAALVTGSGTRTWREIDFAAQRVELWIDGALRVSMGGTHPAVDPFTIVPWLARHCAARCGGLRAGDVVTTGSWTGMARVAAGARVQVLFPGIGEAQAEITR